MDAQQLVFDYENARREVENIQAEAERRSAQIMEVVRDELAALTEEMAPAILQATERLNTTEAALRSAVLAEGKTVKGEEYMATFNKGRTTWDTSKLEGFAVAHPELMVLKKVGEPTVSIREIK